MWFKNEIEYLYDRKPLEILLCAGVSYVVSIFISSSFALIVVTLSAFSYKFYELLDYVFGPLNLIRRITYELSINHVLLFSVIMSYVMYILFILLWAISVFIAIKVIKKFRWVES